MDEQLFIIVAEDDEDDRFLLQEALEEVAKDASVVFAQDGVELLDQLAQLNMKRVNPLVLLDLNMPRMSGREVLKTLRQDAVYRTTPVVVLSTSSAREDVDEAYLLGANTFFTKPPRFADLLHTVRAVYTYWSELAEHPSPHRSRA